MRSFYAILSLLTLLLLVSLAGGVVEVSVRLLAGFWQDVLCAQETEEDGGCLGAGGAALWGEGGFCHAADVAFVVGPKEDVVKTTADA